MMRTEGGEQRGEQRGERSESGLPYTLRTDPLWTVA